MKAFSQGNLPHQHAWFSKLPMALKMITGEEDEKFVSLLYEAKKIRPQLDMEIAPGCSHMVHFQNPLLFVKMLSAFIKEVLKKKEPA